MEITPVVLFILAIVWAVYLGSWIRSRQENRGVNSITSFSKHLSVLERTSPARAGIDAPHRMGVRRPTPIYPAVGYQPRPTMSLAQARRRRKAVLQGLASAAVATLLLALVMGTPALVLHLLVDACLAGYVVLLARTQRLAAERKAKVRYLPHVVSAYAFEDPQVLLESGS
jgi:hypothetical protein